jgi:hypothetical protein
MYQLTSRPLSNFPDCGASTFSYIYVRPWSINIKCSCCSSIAPLLQYMIVDSSGRKFCLLINTVQYLWHSYRWFHRSNQVNLFQINSFSNDLTVEPWKPLLPQLISNMKGNLPCYPAISQLLLFILKEFMDKTIDIKLKIKYINKFNSFTGLWVVAICTYMN